LPEDLNGNLKFVDRRYEKLMVISSNFLACSEGFPLKILLDMTEDAIICLPIRLVFSHALKLLNISF
jgi:hypothetical protein